MTRRRQTREVWQGPRHFFQTIIILKGRLASGNDGKARQTKEPPGDVPVLRFGSGPVAENLESFCRGRVLAVDMIDSIDPIEIEDDVLASVGGVLRARGVMDVIDEVLRPGIGPEREDKRCTGVAG